MSRPEKKGAHRAAYEKNRNQDNVVIVGHTKYKAARLLGLDEVDVRLSPFIQAKKGQTRKAKKAR